MKQLFFLPFAVLIFTSCALFAPKQRFTITANIQNFSDQYLYYPKNFVASRNAELDSIWVKNGKFTLSGNVKEPSLFVLSQKNYQNVLIDFIIENSEIKIELDASKPKSLKIEGSKSNDLYLQFGKDFKAAFDTKAMTFYPDKEEELITQFRERIQEHPSHVISLYSAKDLCFYLYSGCEYSSQLDSIREILRPQFEERKEFQYIETFIDACKRRKLGEKLIQLPAKGIKGEAFKLNDHLGKSYVFLDCWASWCGPCRLKMPEIKRIYQKYKQKGFQVVSVSFDSDRKLWEQAIQQDSTQTFINISELKHYDNSLANYYCINRIPDNFLLNEKGEIIANGLETDQLEQMLDSLYCKQ